MIEHAVQEEVTLREWTLFYGDPLVSNEELSEKESS